MTSGPFVGGTPHSDSLEQQIEMASARYKDSSDWFTRFLGEMTQLLGSRVSQFTVDARHDITPLAYAAEVILLVEDCKSGFNFTSQSLQPGSVPSRNLPRGVIGRNPLEYDCFKFEAIHLARQAVGAQFADDARQTIRQHEPRDIYTA